MTEKSTYEKFNQKFREDKKRVFEKNKLLFFRLPAIFFALYLSLCPIKSVLALELSADEQAYLQSKGTIVFVSQTRYPPFEFIYQKGEHTGMCIELARWMATEFGFTANFTDTYFNQAQQDILSSKADVLTSFFYSKKRDESFDFTQPMFEVPASIFVIAERTDIKDVQDLNGRRIAMQAGDYAKEFLELKGIKFDIVYSKNFAEATDLVIAGKADAVIGDEQIVLYHIFQDNLTDKIKKVGDPLYIGQNCMATKEGNQILISILNKGIKLAQTSGVLEKINRKWIGTHYNPRESLLFKYLPHLYVTVGTIFVLALLSWTWNIRLRQAVRERTEELQKSEGRYRSLTDDVLDSSVVAIVILDSEFRVVWVNRAFERYFGMQRNEVIGKDQRQLIREQIKDVFEDPDTFCVKVLATYDNNSYIEKFECHILPNNGRQERRLEYWSQPIRFGLYAGGRIEHYSDISVRKQAEEDLKRNERFLNAIVENIPDMIFVKDAEKFQFVRFNKAGENLLGYNREELIGKNDYDFFPKEQADFFTEKDKKVIERGTLLNIPEEPIHTRYKGERILHTKKIPLINEKGQPEYLLGISEDITERKLTEEKVVRAKEEWESTFNSVPDLIAIVDDKYRMVRVNKAMADKLGVTPDEAVGLSCYEHVHGTKAPPSFCPHKKLLLDGQEHVAELYDNRLGGIFQVSVTPFHDNDGKLIGSVHMARDITQRKQGEEALATERRRLADILEGTNVGTWEWNVQTGETIFNEQWAWIIGYTLEEISPVSIDTWIKFAHPDDLKMSDELLEKHFSGELDYYECEARMHHKNGDWVWVLDRGKVATWTEDGKPLLMSGTHQDITERKRSEEQIKASLKEKEILLREIHHRVKNNLAVISSLLSMQANIVSDRQVHTALQESQSRVNAMALIHETLHQSESLALVDLGNYVKDLVGNIVNTFEGISGRINFEIEVPDVKLVVNQAVPCGLIINELATNAIKHAFTDGQNGVVKINAKYADDNEIELMVSDNGVGFSEELDWIKSKSLGLRLISLLVDQLHGTLDIKNHHGAQAIIRWPLQAI